MLARTRLNVSPLLRACKHTPYELGPGYVDELILRDRNGDGNTGTGDLGKTSSGLEERLYALQDANWNTVAIADTGGDVQQRQIYDAYGKVTRLNPTTFTTYTGTDYDWKTLYTGRCLDTETGLYYYRNRYYSAELGRFVSRDPLVYVDGLNLYQYVRSNPLLWTDPTGEVAPAVIIAAAVALIEGPILTCFWMVDGFDINAGRGEYADSGDAWRHCLTSCRMSRLCGAQVALLAGYQKELGPNNWDNLVKSPLNTLGDSLDDIFANSECIATETTLNLGVLSYLFREDCTCCCNRKVGFATNVHMIPHKN